MPKTIYQNYDTNYRGFEGIEVAEFDGEAMLATIVKENLVDQEELERFQSDLEDLKGSIQQAGFEVNENLLVDIQSLNDPEPEDTRSWRIGEAIAEVTLEENFEARFHWNELRDARNPKGNKTGADLVGFIETDGEVLFLFGEVKTSSENKRPPQVMTNAEGIEEQLKNLYSSRKKREMLVKYLASKTRNLAPSNSFVGDYKSALKNYYQGLNCTYQLFGVLVRDIEPDPNDLSQSYDRLKTEVLDPTGVRLLAIYISIKKEDWETIITRNDN